MARHYYLTRAGRLRRKDNTLSFEPVAAADAPVAEPEPSGVMEQAQATAELSGADMLGAVGADGMGDLLLEPEAPEDVTAQEQAALEGEQAKAVAVSERRVIPVEDVDALWVFGELDLNARVLVFLAQHRVPVHFFNYYGFYAGTFYPREYLHAGYLVVRQVRHYANRRLRLAIAREF